MMGEFRKDVYKDLEKLLEPIKAVEVKRRINYQIRKLLNKPIVHRKNGS